MRGALIGLAVLAGIAMPLGATQSKTWPTFREADRDANGTLSLDEVRTVPVLADEFALHDKNGDGRLSRAEFEAAKRADADAPNEAGRAADTGARR